MKWLLLTLMVLSLTACKEEGTTSVTASPKKPDPDFPVIPITAVTTPAPTATPAPTPNPLIGVWLNDNDNRDSFAFNADGSGSQSFCGWTFNWTQNSDYAEQIQLTQLLSVQTYNNWCVPWIGGPVSTKTCRVVTQGDVLFMNCMYGKSEQIYIRQ